MTSKTLAHFFRASAAPCPHFELKVEMINARMQTAKRQWRLEGVLESSNSPVEGVVLVAMHVHLRDTWAVQFEHASAFQSSI